MNDQTQVLVLSQTLYKEHDALVQALSYDHGLMSFIAKGVQKMQSKNRGVIQPYSEYRYHFDHKTEGRLQILKHAELIQSNHHIQGDLMRSSLASLLVELTEFIVRNESDSMVIQETYTQLREQFKLIDQETHLEHVFILILMHFIDSYGIEPSMDACVLCEDTQINSFSIEEGGLICQACQREIHSPIYPVDFLRTLRISSRLRLVHFETFKTSTALSSDLIKTWLKFIEFHTGIQLKSWEFMRKWSIIL